MDTIWQNNTFLVKEMPAFKKFSPAEVTNIINFMQHRWQPTAFVENDINDVEKYLGECDSNK